jgi:hypothetical protein
MTVRKIRNAQQLTGRGRDRAKIDTGKPSESARQFLLAEYSRVQDVRASTLTLVENRIKFVMTLPASEIAFVGVMATRARTSGDALALIILTLSIPTLVFAHLVYLRQLDFQIMGRRYLRALNAIRGFFIAQHPEIKDAILMSTDRTKPSMRSVGGVPQLNSTQLCDHDAVNNRPPIDERILGGPGFSFTVSPWPHGSRPMRTYTWPVVSVSNLG